jgi:hypothetical protein
VKLVLVDVSVTGDDDQPLADLTPADFELTEDGLPQTVEQVTLVRLDGAPRGNGEALEIRSQDHAIAEAGRDDVRLFAVFMDDYHLGRYPQEMLPLRKGLTDFLGAMMGPLDLVTVMNPITPLSALEWTRDKAKLVRAVRTYEGRNDNFIGRSALEESQGLSRNIFRVRSQVVITALQALVMHLSGLREGRKTLLFVSRGIPLMFDVSLEPDFQARCAGQPAASCPRSTARVRPGHAQHNALPAAGDRRPRHRQHERPLEGPREGGARRQPSLPHRLRADPRTERRQVPQDRREGEAQGRAHGGAARLLGAIGRRDDRGCGRAARTGGVIGAREPAVAAREPRGARRDGLRARQQRRRAPVGHVAACRASGPARRC